MADKSERSTLEKSATPSWAAWLPVVGIVLPAVVGLLIWSGNADAERRQNDYERREQRYAGLVSSLPGFYSDGSREEKERFLNELALCWLYCDDTVIRQANVLINSVQRGAASMAGDRERNAKVLMLAIRQDLLRRKPVEDTGLRADEFLIVTVPK